MYLTTDNLDPNRQDEIENFDQIFLGVLPKDYLDFLHKFGIGEYCGEVYIEYPDSQIIPSTFKDYTDLWELNNSSYNVEDLLKSIQIGSTANGDIVCVTENRVDKIFILPRHSMEIIAFSTFETTIKSFITEEKSTIYFDPLFDSKQEQISLIKSGGLIDILPIHEKFLQQFSFDFVTNENTQPKYFFKKIGGWVTFDLIYKNSIYVKFQNQHLNDVSPITNFLREYTE